MAKGASEPLKILYVSAEVAPFSKQGGLSQVSYFLPHALRRQGVDVRIFTPKYGTQIDQNFDLAMLIEGLEVPTGETDSKRGPEKLICNVKVTTLENNVEPLQVYFVENMEYYEMRNNVYGYSDDHIRFGLLSRAALEFIKRGEFVPDVVHCNDWHTGYLVNWLAEEREHNARLGKVATLMSVHNTYQGNYDYSRTSEMDFDDGKSELAPFFTDRFLKQNALKRGVMHADRINTVSEKYARELLDERYGGGLHKLFKELRGKTSGILNGLDYTDFDPATDTIIKQNFSLEQLDKRAVNKRDLQLEFDLNLDPSVPVLAIAGRIDQQKGMDLVQETIGFVLDEFDVQLVVSGPCDPHYVGFFEDLARQYPGRVGTHLMADFLMPRKIFAGSDMILMPSYYEPGGIVAIEAMRYGCVPVVRAVGGLADSVEDYDPTKETGTGFAFKSFADKSFLVAVVRALMTYKRTDSWRRLVERAMAQDFSWDNVAQQYVDLYGRTRDYRQEATTLNPPSAYRQRMM